MRVTKVRVEFEHNSNIYEIVARYHGSSNFSDCYVNQRVNNLSKRLLSHVSVEKVMRYFGSKGVCLTLIREPFSRFDK